MAVIAACTFSLEKFKPSLLLCKHGILIFYKLKNQVPEAVAWRCSIKMVFLKISQNSQENTCVRVSFLILRSDITSQIAPLSCESFFMPFWSTIKNSGQAGSRQEDRL